MRDVLCLAVGQTYDMVIQTGITAHPAVAPYPRFEPLYVAPIKKGGTIEYLYRVKHIIECMPDDIFQYKDILADKDYKSLEIYHKNRKSTFGYSKKSTLYRFYILESEEFMVKPYIKKGIQISARIDLSEIKGTNII